MSPDYLPKERHQILGETYYLSLINLMHRSGILDIVEEPNLKMCIIKGDNWRAKGPTKNLYILSPQMVLMTVWGGSFSN